MGSSIEQLSEDLLGGNRDPTNEDGLRRILDAQNRASWVWLGHIISP